MQINKPLNKPFAMLAVACLLVVVAAGVVIVQNVQGPEQGEPLPLVMQSAEKKTLGVPAPQATTAIPPSRNATEALVPVVERAEVSPAMEPPLVPEPVLQPVASAPAPASATATVPMPVSVPSRAPVETPVPPAPSATAVPAPTASPAMAPTGGSLARLTAARAQLAEVQVQVQIEEQLSKLRGYQTPQLPVALALPPLPSTPERGEGVPSRQRGNRVVAVSGVAGNVVAIVQTAWGTRRVRVGDALDGGRVEAISRDGVTIRQGGRAQTILFGE